MSEDRTRRRARVRAWGLSERVFSARCARRTRVRAWGLGLGLLVLVVYLGFIALAILRLPGAVGN